MSKLKSLRLRGTEAHLHVIAQGSDHTFRFRSQRVEVLMSYVTGWGVSLSDDEAKDLAERMIARLRTMPNFAGTRHIVTIRYNSNKANGCNTTLVVYEKIGRKLFERTKEDAFQCTAFNTTMVLIDRVFKPESNDSAPAAAAAPAAE